MIEAKYRDCVYDLCHHLRSLHTGIPIRKLLNDAADSLEKLEAERDALMDEIEQLEAELEQELQEIKQLKAKLEGER